MHTEDQYKRRFGFVLMAIGVGLILVGLAMVLHYRHQLGQADPQPEPATPAKTIEAIQAIKVMLFWLLVLVGIFAVSSFAFLRWSRRFRAYLFRKPRPPTPCDDVWAMHKLPDEAEAEFSGPSDSPDTDDTD